MLSLQQRFDRINVYVDMLTDDIRFSGISYCCQDVFLDKLDKIRTELHMIKKHMPSPVEQ